MMTDAERKAARKRSKREYLARKRGEEVHKRKGGLPAESPRCPVCGEPISVMRDCNCPTKDTK